METERRYLHEGRVAHLLVAGAELDRRYAQALCGTYPRHNSWWFGGGTPLEREIAGAMVVCGRCAKRAG